MTKDFFSNGKSSQLKPQLDRAKKSKTWFQDTKMLAGFFIEMYAC